MRLAVCVGCGRRPTASRDKRCVQCKLPSRPRGRGFQAIRTMVFERDKGICHICAKPVVRGQRWHIDHVRPRARGGADSIENYALAHDTCNLRKGTST